MPLGGPGASAAPSAAQSKAQSKDDPRNTETGATAGVERITVAESEGDGAMAEMRAAGIPEEEAIPEEDEGILNSSSDKAKDAAKEKEKEKAATGLTAPMTVDLKASVVKDGDEEWR